MALSIPSSPPAPGSLPAADTELSQEAVTGLNLEQQHADRDSGAPAARDLGLAAANGSAAAVSRCEAVALPAPKEGQPLSPSAIPVSRCSCTGHVMEWHRSCTEGSLPLPPLSAQQRH